MYTFFESPFFQGGYLDKSQFYIVTEFYLGIFFFKEEILNSLIILGFLDNF